MVLSNQNPYSSEDDSDVEPWELISEPQDGAELHLEEENTEHEEVDGSSSRTREDAQGVKEPEIEVEANANNKAGGDDVDRHEHVPSSDSVGSDGGKEQSAYDEKSRVAWDEAEQTEPKTPSNANDENADPWTRLNSEDIPQDRPESPDQHLPLPLHQTWNFITSSLREIDNQNQLRQRAQTGARKLNNSAQNMWTNLQAESQRLATTLQQHCDQADVQAREASLNIKQTVSSTKDNLCRLNAEYKIHEKVAAVAAVSGAVLLAAGNPRAGAVTLVAAGGAMAAGEAMGASSERGCSTFTRDYGLREGVHLD